MSGLDLQRNIGALFTGLFSDIIAVTAAGAGDNTEASGAWIDRGGFESAKITIIGQTTLAEDETLAIVAANMQDASDSSGTDAADYGTAYAPSAETVTNTGGSGGSTEDVAIEFDVDLVGADEFVRFQVTPNMSASATDTATLQVAIHLGGNRTEPSSVALAELGPDKLGESVT